MKNNMLKRIFKTAASLLAAAAMLLCFVSCGSDHHAADVPLMQGVFEKLQTTANYVSWKKLFEDTTFKEKLDGDQIVLSAKGDEDVNCSYTFTLDGDFIVTASEPDDRLVYTYLSFLKDAVAEYYGMSGVLVSGYLAGLERAGKENPFFLTEQSEDQSVYKLYAGDEWDMPGIDEMYVDDAAVAGYGPLDENNVTVIVNSGKISLGAFGNAEDIYMIVGEYGKNTERTYNSIIAAVKALAPKGCEAFCAGFTGLRETQGDGYAVYMGVPERFAEINSFGSEPGYSYITVVFGCEEDA